MDDMRYCHLTRSVSFGDQEKDKLNFNNEVVHYRVNHDIEGKRSWKGCINCFRHSLDLGSHNVLLDTAYDLWDRMSFEFIANVK